MEKGTEKKRGLVKEREGIIVSDKMDKTIVVAVTRQVMHPTYGKFIRKTSKYLVHDEKEEGGMGDLVKIREARALSKRKRWRLAAIVRKAT